MINEESGIKEIRANRFILEDETGKIRAELSIFENGPGLELYYENVKEIWRAP